MTTPKATPRIWLHCPDPARLPAACALAEALCAENTRRKVFITLPETAPKDLFRQTQAHTITALPLEKSAHIKAFLEEWQPTLLIWMEGHLRSLLLAQVRERKIPSLIVDAAAEHLPQPTSRWLSLRVQAPLAHFAHGLALDGPSAQRLTRLGLGQTEISGLIDPLPRVLRCHEGERVELAESIGARPVWLACDIPLKELGEVILAHRTALRGAHRLLLILQPSLESDEREVRRRLDAAGFQVAERANDDLIEDNVDVYLVDSAFELGLWYRLASITFMGSTLTLGHTSRSPLEPAALGSAIIAGPQLFPYGSTYLRLERAGGTRLVRSGLDLARAIDHLLSPENAAQMAFAAWGVVTAGVASTTRVVELVQSLLEPSQ